MSKIANIFVPLLLGIIAAGLIMGITNVITVSTGGACNNLWWFVAIKSLSFAMFGYLVLYVGMNYAKECGGTPLLGVIMGLCF